MSMTSLQRVMTSLGHQEPDRVPFFLLLTMHGARELQLSIKDYFSRAEYVVEGQLRLREKYHHDCYLAFTYAPIEVEAWGGEVVYYDDGPPNSGRPFLHDSGLISKLQPPDIAESECLQRVLKITEDLKKHAADEVPVLGVVVSPFSLPVMQMGFSAYLDLIYQQPELFWKLMRINEDFCVTWANAQLAAGATAIAYFDPVSSPTIISPQDYLRTGHIIAKRTLARINGPTATHLASGRCLSIVDALTTTGTSAIGVSALESLAEVKRACNKRLAVIGNLNGIEMARWTPEQARHRVQEAIMAAGSGGGFILADNHGEIPYQVTDEILHAISSAVHTYGCYPLPG